MPPRLVHGVLVDSPDPFSGPSTITVSPWSSSWSIFSCWSMCWSCILFGIPSWGFTVPLVSIGGIVTVLTLTLDKQLVIIITMMIMVILLLGFSPNWKENREEEQTGTSVRSVGKIRTVRDLPKLPPRG